MASWRQNHHIGFVVICEKCHEILILVLTFFLVPSEIRSTFDKKVGRRPTGRSEALRLNGWTPDDEGRLGGCVWESIQKYQTPARYTPKLTVRH